MELRDYKLRLKKFWRDNERLILMIIAAFIVGSILAGINFLNHQNTLNKFQLGEDQVITNDRKARFSFPLNNPGLATDTTVELRFENVSSGAPLAVKLNGQQIQTVESNQVIIPVSANRLQLNNTVVVERTELGFQEQYLVDASVTSRTNFQQVMFIVINMFSIILMAAPIGYIKYRQYKDQKIMEEKFPEFLRDVVEGTRAGMSLPQAIQNTETGSYGPLNSRIEKMNAQLDWGIPFDQALRNFADETNSDTIVRSVDTIIQAYQSGGNIQDVLDSVGDNIRTIKNLKEERESQLYGEMVTGYIVYFIFIGILIALTNYLLPNLASAQQSLGGTFAVLGGGGGASLQENIALYKTWFQRLVFIKAGIKHVAILFATGYLTVTFFL